MYWQHLHEGSWNTQVSVDSVGKTSAIPTSEIKSKGASLPLAKCLAMWFSKILLTFIEILPRAEYDLAMKKTN